jgi:hypothetical protein
MQPNTQQFRLDYWGRGGANAHLRSQKLYGRSTPKRNVHSQGITSVVQWGIPRPEIAPS